MGITTFSFLYFCIILVLLYFVLPHKLQAALLLLFSMFFYQASGGWRMLFFILTTSVVTYLAAVAVEMIGKYNKTVMGGIADKDEKMKVRAVGVREKKTICAVSIIFILGIWSVLKYSAFIVDSLNSILSLFKIEKSLGLPSFVLPLGISFYSFHAVGYLVDIFRGKYPAERNYFRLLLFLIFFPHITQGPFSRYDRLGKTLFEQHAFSYERFCLGMRRMLWGFSKKLLVADKLGVAMTDFYTNYQDCHGIFVWVAILGFAVQIYADFSGYMDIMCGLCRILDIELSENFKQPLFADSVENFWQRWHITLGAWFKDYVFSPIAMGKYAQKIGHSFRMKFGARVGKYAPGYFALFFVWTLTGLWHGAKWTYVIWGWMNLLIIMFSMQFQPVYDKIKNLLHIKDNSRLWRLFCIVRTFFIVSFFRFFSRTGSVAIAFTMVKNIFYRNYRHILHPFQLLPQMDKIDVLFVAVGFAAMLAVDVYKELGCKKEFPMPIRTIGYASMVIALVLGAGGSNDLISGFMYAQF